MPKLRHYIKRPRAAVQTAYSPAQIAKAYNFPTGLAPGGVIAIIELGGGWVASDIETFCQKYGIPMPKIIDVECDAKNVPGGDADGEVALDIEVAAGVYSYCTGAPAGIRVYWATDIAPACQKILGDIQAGIPIAAVSISWGAAENVWGADACNATDLQLARLATLGVPFFAASGDNDSGDGEPGRHVDFPASSPHVIGCGGTTKTAAKEVVWNNGPGEGTGGGYSSIFPVQAWQTEAPSGAGRMVPDVAGNADPHTGYEIFCQGQWQVVGGTSAVAPLYAGLFAAMKPKGITLFEVPAPMWANPQCFTDITLGDNGGFKAAVGPDPCTGLGVPNGAALKVAFVGGPSPQPAPGPSPQPPTPPSPQPSPEPQPGHGPGHHPGHGGHHHGHGRHKIADRLWYSRDGEKVVFHVESNDGKTGEQVGSVDLSVMASVVCDLSPMGEESGRHGYVLDFLRTGAMLCAGCGAVMNETNPSVGTLGYLQRPCCGTCYVDKFKPFFDAMRNERAAQT